MWTKAQQAAFQRALATTMQAKPVLERLRLIAQHAPQFLDRVNDLCDQCEHTESLARIALSLDGDTPAST